MGFNSVMHRRKPLSAAGRSGVEAAFDAAFATVAPFVNKTGALGNVTAYSEVPIAARARIQAAAYALASNLTAVRVYSAWFTVFILDPGRGFAGYEMNELLEMSVHPALGMSAPAPRPLHLLPDRHEMVWSVLR